jgi:dipeptidyl aminopeptidase/acylaminoacyl peptidase
MKKLIFLLVAISFIYSQKSQLQPTDLWKFLRISNLSVCEKNNIAAFNVQKWDIENNSANTDIYILDLKTYKYYAFIDTKDNELNPIFSNDGNYLYFTRKGEIIRKKISDGTEENICNIPTKASGLVISPNDKYILFTSEVYPNLTPEETVKKDEELSKTKVKAKIFDKLLFRHWDSWRDDKRSHLFLLYLTTKKYIDITYGLKNDVPPLALGSNSDYNFSPDSKEIAICYNEEEFLATSTNNDIFIIKIDEIKENQKPNLYKISTSKGVDCMPKYSPDNRYLAFLSMKRAGYEADKKDIVLFDRQNQKLLNLTNNFKLSVEEYSFSKDAKKIYFTAQNEVNSSIYVLDIEKGNIELVLKNNYNYNISLTNDGIYFLKQKTTLPTEVFKCDLNGKNEQQITFINKDLLDKIVFGKTLTFWYKGANKVNVQSQMILPPFFDTTKTYPMLLLIHGGPQGAWEDDFHYRWNVQMFAALGYVVIAPNIRGSVGYGQEFTDGVNLDWGGKPYIDAMNCVDYVVKNYKFVDKKNLFAAGASYGGYMMNWIATHTDRFNAIVTHAGVFNLESMYGSTEELWFPEWEYGGTPFDNNKIYQKYSPHKYVKNIKTPVLVVHGAYDFRVPESQAFELFTYLQRLGIKSKFLYFPDETHFVAKPQNSLLWWSTIKNWFEENKK